jgi:hypothetical protein
MDFKKLNATTNKDPYPLVFTNEVINIVVGHELYTFLDVFSTYYQILITHEDQYKIIYIKY